MESADNNVREILEHVADEFSFVLSEWQLHQYLFMDSALRVELLNKVSGVFFAHLQKIHLEHIAIGVCRLTDKPKTSGQSNASIDHVLELFTPLSTSRDARRLQKAKLLLNRTVPRLREWRNTQFSHAALRTMERGKRSTNIIPRDIHRTLQLIYAVLRHIYLRHFDVGWRSVETDWAFDLDSMLERFVLGVDAHQRIEDARQRGESVDYPEIP